MEKKGIDVEKSEEKERERLKQNGSVFRQAPSIILYTYAAPARV